MTTVGLLDLLRDGRIIDAKPVGDNVYLASYDPAKLSEAQAAAFLRVAYGYDTKVVTPDGRTITSSVRDLDLDTTRWTATR